MKQLVKSMLGRDLPVRIGLARRRGQCLVLAWHNVVPANTKPFGDRSLHLDFDGFRRQLDRLPSALNVVSLDGMLQHPDDHAPRCVLTFDDAYAGALRLALPELESRSLPMTMFVAPGLLGERATWWDAFADPSSGLSPAFRQIALQECAGDFQRVAERAKAMGLVPHYGSEWHAIGSFEQLATASTLAGITFGSHSWGHPNFGVMSEQRYQDELVHPLEWLRAHFPANTIPWLAWPYGEANAQAQTAAASLYAGLLKVDGGWMSQRGRAHAIPRLNVPSGMNADALRAAIAGWLPA